MYADYSGISVVWVGERCIKRRELRRVCEQGRFRNGSGFVGKGFE